MKLPFKEQGSAGCFEGQALKTNVKATSPETEMKVI